MKTRPFFCYSKSNVLMDDQTVNVEELTLPQEKVSDTFQLLSKLTPWISAALVAASLIWLNTRLGLASGGMIGITILAIVLSLGLGYLLWKDTEKWQGLFMVVSGVFAVFCNIANVSIYPEPLLRRC